MDASYFILNDLATILQGSHVTPLLSSRIHEASDALLDIADEDVVLVDHLFRRCSNHAHLRLEHPHLVRKFFVVVVF